MTAPIPRDYAEARAAADAARDRANARREWLQGAIQDQIAAGTQNGQRYAREHPAVLLGRLLARDDLWKVAVADNQWYIQYATMYAQGELLEQQRQVLGELRAVLDLLVPPEIRDVDPA